MTKEDSTGKFEIRVADPSLGGTYSWNPLLKKDEISPEARQGFRLNREIRIKHRFHVIIFIYELQRKFFFQNGRFLHKLNDFQY